MKKLRILFLADSENDTALLLQHLINGGYDVISKRIETPFELTASLQEDDWDAVISEFSMPQFTGPDAVKILKRSGKDIPFIIVSGKMGEENAVKAMKSGVQDYIPKGNLARLIPAIERELNEFQERRKRKFAETELKVSRELYRNFIEQSSEGIYRTDFKHPIDTDLPEEEQANLIGKEGYIGECNNAMAEMYGFRKASDLIGVNLNDLRMESSGAKTFQEHLFFVRNKYRISEQEIEHRGAKGNKKYYQTNAVGIIRQDKLIGIWGTQKDITEKKKMDEELRESRNRYEALFDSFNDMVFIIEIQNGLPGRIIEYNETFLKKLEYSSGGLSDKLYSELDQNFKSTFRNYQAANSGKQKFLFETALLKSTGQTVPVEVSMSVLNFEGKLVAISVARDISERKKSEAELHKLSMAVKQSSATVIITNTKGDIEFVNPKFTATTGYSFEEVYGKNPRILRSGKTSDEDYKKLWRDISIGKEWRGEFHNKRKNGELYWESASISPIKNEKGEITHFLAIKEDITEKKTTELALKKSEKRFRTLIQNVGSIVIYISPENKILEFNQKAEKIFDEKRESVLNTDFLNLFSAQENRHKALSALDKLKSGTESDGFETVINRDKEKYLILWNFISLLDDSNNQTGVIASGQDITDRIEAEHELRIAKEKAEKSDRLKTVFLAQMSHEIRTPVNAILSFTSLLRSELEDSVPEELKESFKIVDNGGRRLIRTIDSILNMSQFQTGSYEAAFESLDVDKDILQNVMKEFQLLAEVKGLNFRYHNQANKRKIYGDSYTVSQIFANLLDNAVKYTNAGEVEVRLNNEKEKITVEVRDTGVGISDEYIPSLFEPFTQEEMGYSRRFEGNGLGLALVKKYCELNKAEIAIDSKKDSGSVFSISFKTID
jgi:PAS domain S-box-containing protein